MGFSLIPLSAEPADARKRPPKKFSWKRYQFEGTTPGQVQEWGERYPGCNWGLLLGQPSGVIAVDVDSAKAFRWCHIQGGFNEELPVWFETGRGWQWLFRLPSELLDVRGVNPHPGVEIRSNGQYSVIPPSIHPSGKPYAWRKPPQSLDAIPYAPQWVLDALTGRLNAIPLERPTTLSAAQPKPATAPAELAGQNAKLLPKKSAQKPSATQAVVDVINSKKEATATKHRWAEQIPEITRPKTPQILASTNRALLKSHAFWFIEHGVFPGPTATEPGCRNTACYLYAVLMKGAGIRRDTALARVLEWAKRQAPAYGLKSDENPRAIVDAVWKCPYRPDSGRLLSLVTVAGNRLTVNQARQAVRFYPEYRNEGDWTKKPALDAVLRVLQVLVKRKVRKPTPISLRELADEAGISIRRVEEVAPFFDAIGVRTAVKRRGRSFVSYFSLSTISTHPTPLHTKSPHGARVKSQGKTNPQSKTLQVCLCFVVWRGYLGKTERAVRWLRRRLGRLLKQVLDLVSAVLLKVSCVSWCEIPSISNARLDLPPTRAPPTDLGRLGVPASDLRGNPASC